MADSNRFSYDYNPTNGDPPVTHWVELSPTPPHYQPGDFRSIDDRLHRAKTPEVSIVFETDGNNCYYIKLISAVLLLVT